MRKLIMAAVPCLAVMGVLPAGAGDRLCDGAAHRMTAMQIEVHRATIEAYGRDTGVPDVERYVELVYETLRLFDVDAPELAQTCDGGPARLRPCGAYVADALAERLAGREVRCTVLKLD